MLFSSQGLAADFWKERNKGTLRRLVSTPGRPVEFVIGKSLAAAIVISGIAGITLFLGFLLNGISWMKFVSSMLWLLLAGIGFFGWFSALQMLFPSQKVASLLTLIVLFPMMMMGGSFFPLDALPEWLADIDGIEFEANGTLQVTPVGGPLVRFCKDNDIQILAGEGIGSANHGYAANLKLALIPTGFDNTVIAIRIDACL